VRTDPTISHNKFEPPWEIFEGQHSIGDVRQPGPPPSKLVYCHGKADALTLDSTKAKVKSIARVDKNIGPGGGPGGGGGAGGVEAARVQAVTAPWHGGAWGDSGGGPVVADAYPTPPGTPPVWSSDDGGGAAVRQPQQQGGRGGGEGGGGRSRGSDTVDGLRQAWERSL
jgi:hypothetical protein